MGTLRVLVVGDSALVRSLLSEILDSDPEIEVIGTARDAYVAREKINQLRPDVLTLDVEMPRMDGIAFLRNLMRLHPMPVLMVSSLTAKGADVTLDALALGAVDFVTKPRMGIAGGLYAEAEEIIEKVKIAGTSRVRALSERRARCACVDRNAIASKFTTDAALPHEARLERVESNVGLIAIGASVGGTEAIKEVLRQLPADAPGVVVVQHIAGSFTSSFARRLDSESQMRVVVAERAREIRRGEVLVAPEAHHMRVRRRQNRLVSLLCDGPRVNCHLPSIDVLFRSVAENLGPNAVGVLLTGMGTDGARGLKEMREAGAFTIAQDENTSLVWGMPGAAVELGAVQTVLPLEEIPEKILAGAR